MPRVAKAILDCIVDFIKCDLNWALKQRNLNENWGSKSNYENAVELSWWLKVIKK